MDQDWSLRWRPCRSLSFLFFRPLPEWWWSGSSVVVVGRVVVVVGRVVVVVGRVVGVIGLVVVVVDRIAEIVGLVVVVVDIVVVVVEGLVVVAFTIIEVVVVLAVVVEVEVVNAKSENTIKIRLCNIFFIIKEYITNVNQTDYELTSVCRHNFFIAQQAPHDDICYTIFVTR